MKKYLAVFFLFYATATLAIPLNGSFEENSDGSFLVNADDGYHEFSGWADEEDDDTLDVYVKDIHGNIYVGKAHRNFSKGYALDLRNEATGDFAAGYIYPK